MATRKNNKVKVYKSLYKVKDKYFPKAGLDFLESNDNDLSREAFMQMLKKISTPLKKDEKEKKKT